jgi:hypothetical protein
MSGEGESMALRSWNDGVVKQAILDSVATSGEEDGPGYVPPA